MNTSLWETVENRLLCGVEVGNDRGYVNIKSGTIIYSCKMDEEESFYRQTNYEIKTTILYKNDFTFSYMCVCKKINKINATEL